jgi:V8-like Glu-specific endopeptidase
LLSLVASCGPAGLEPQQEPSPLVSEDPIVNGSLNPTLYTSLTTQQRNAVVALCYSGGYGCFCSGTMISRHVVLTAAHCIDQRPEGQILTAGDVEIHVGPDNSAPSQVLSARAVDFVDKSTESTDVGVVIISATAPNTTTTVTPLPIKTGGVSAIEGHNAQAVGFGMTYVNDYNNTDRHWTTLPAVDEGWGVITTDGYGDTGVGSGDSGGPLLYDFGTGVRVAGVASTSVVTFVDEAYYHAVSSEEAFVQSFVDAYDNPACATACSGVQCGQSGGCECGGCNRGYQCISNLCQLIQPGTGGVCLTMESTATQCENNEECYGDEICYPYGNGDSECGEACGPQRCKPSDAYSVCLPVGLDGGGYLKVCYESSGQASCDWDEPFCTTSDGRSGYCLCTAGTSTTCSAAECFGRCDTVVTCPDGSGCVPYVQSCNDVCQTDDCGEISGCDCGDCALGTTCVDNQCVCAPECTSRQCGGDGCGGFCGVCSGTDVCNAYGRCIPYDLMYPDEGTSCGNCNAAGSGLAGAAGLLAWVRRRRRRALSSPRASS